ncbi:MAG: IclR family transcriptional regulator [Luteitalea sp.]|nr:IclR family transcriptional regulator [Acidobacteriota bacterium]
MPRSPAAAPRKTASRPRNDKYYSKVIGRALEILAVLRTSEAPLGLAELASHVGLAKSSVFRLLHTLEVSSYIERTADGAYRLSADLRVWGDGKRVTDMVDAALPPMRALSHEFGETITLAMHFDNRIEVVATLDSPQLIRMANTVGRILPPHASSLGKAITAYQPDAVTERLRRSYGNHRFTEHSITDEVALKQEYERIRAQGYSTDAEESVLEGCCFGAPISGQDDVVVAALSLSLPKMRLRDKAMQKRIVAAVRDAAEQTRKSLGRRP